MSLPDIKVVGKCRLCGKIYESVNALDVERDLIGCESKGTIEKRFDWATFTKESPRGLQYIFLMEKLDEIVEGSHYNVYRGKYLVIFPDKTIRKGRGAFFTDENGLVQDYSDETIERVSGRVAKTMATVFENVRD